MSRHNLAFAALVACAIGFSPAAKAAVTITIDKSIQEMVVEVDGRPIYQWPVSTGKGAQYDTPAGAFKAFRMEREHFSKEWDDAPMPHSIFFTKRGHAIHGSFDTKRLGTPASHGCVRLLPANAKTLFELVEREGVLNTTVTLVGVTPSSAPAVASRRAPRNTDDLDPYYQAPQQPNRYGNQPGYNPYYAQQQYQQPYGQQQYQPYGQQQYQPYGRPNTLPRPGYVYRDPYSGQVYQQQRPGGTLFPY